jgi:enhancing lycopene biosynthesis protein 2
MKITAALILSGSGHQDGSEIREAVGALWALSYHPVRIEAFAPDMEFDVIDHRTGTPTGEVRNVLTESARIMRGSIKPLSELVKTDYQAMILPGGYGAAKNLSTFAEDGASGRVLHPELEHDLIAMHGSGMPIGAMCIAPAVVALALRNEQIEVTVGESGGAAHQIEKIGHRHIAKAAHEIHIDERNNIITTPAYMYDDAPLHDIFTGIKNCVDEVIRRIKK